MRTRLTSLPAALGAALLAVTLTSCSGDPEPIIEPAPSTSPSPSSAPPASPSATPPPDEPESAKAFIRRFQAATYAMQESGDTSVYLSMTDSCSSCDALASRVEAIYEEGGSVRTGGGSVTSIERVGKARAVQVFEYKLDSKPSRVLGNDGSVETQFDGGKSVFQVNVSKKSSEWLVLRISRVPA